MQQLDIDSSWCDLLAERTAIAVRKLTDKRPTVILEASLILDPEFLGGPTFFLRSPRILWRTGILPLCCGSWKTQCGHPPLEWWVHILPDTRVRTTNTTSELPCCSEVFSYVLGFCWNGKYLNIDIFTGTLKELFAEKIAQSGRDSRFCTIMTA